MTYGRALWETETATVTCLGLFAVSLALILTAVAAVYGATPTLEGGLVTLAFTLLFGAVPATLVFAPIYAFFRKFRRSHPASAAAIGAASSLIFLVVYYFLEAHPFVTASGLAIYAVPAGIIVGVGVHFLLSKYR